MKKLLLALLILSSFSCSNNLFGTNTGNPDQHGQTDPDPDCGGRIGPSMRCMPTPYPILTVGRITDKIEQCTGVADSHDQNFQLLSDQVGLNLELPVKEINFSALQSNYNLKKVYVDVTSFQNCMKAIYDLDCNSVIFKNAYDINDQMNFTNIHKIFRAEPACLIVFSDKE